MQSGFALCPQQVLPIMAPTAVVAAAEAEEAVCDPLSIPLSPWLKVPRCEY